MSRKILSSFALLLVLVAVFTVCSFAQEEEKIFKLSRGELTPEQELDLENEVTEIWIPALSKGDFSVAFTLGFMDMGSTLLKHDQIVYKYNDLATYWGDVDIAGESAFSPSLRLNYHITKWLAVEGISNFSTCDYSASIENRRRRNNNEGAIVDSAEPALEEFDAETRSLATFNGSINAVWYPLNMGEDSPTGKRFYPYITAGIGKMYFNMNSDYTDGTASTTDMNFGGGIRFLIDKAVSIRLEAIVHNNSLEFIPDDNFKTLDDGATIIPLNEYPKLGVDDEITERVVTKFNSNTINALQLNIGFQINF